MTASSLSFCDVSGLYAPTGGGIRTYHQARLDWFARQNRHRYVLVHAAQRAFEEQVSPTVRVIGVRGIRAGRGYHLPLDLPAISAWVERLAPDVLETGDPWFSGPLGLLAKRRGHTRLVSSFFHGNPIDTYAAPWARRGRLSTLRARALSHMDRGFFRVQRMYDVTVTSSEWIATLLHQRGVRRVVRSAFGADAVFFDVGRRRASNPTPPRGRLLYAGRLQNDKGIDLLLKALPRLLRETDATLTIAGAGPARQALSAHVGARVRLTGFISARSELAALFAEHDVLLAPGPHETFGLSALEGLAAGLQVVGPDAGGTHELLAQLPSARTFKAGDADDFARVVAATITEPHAGGTVEAGLALAERYGTWGDAVSRSVENYCTCLSRCTT